MENRRFVIYGKNTKDKYGRFNALNLYKRKFVDKFIYATILTENEADYMLKILLEQNPDFIFEKWEF